MLQQIQLVRNIGQFDSISPGAQLPLDELTVVYAENGRGKTTLSAILRSLATGDASYIAERHRLGSAHPPHAVLQHAGGISHVFEDNIWSAALPEIAVFDDTFVAQNVCSGIDIAPEHRQNLHELILGSRGVALNADVQTHVAAIEEHNRQLRAKGDAIPAELRGNLTPDQFCDLVPGEDVTARLEETKQRLVAAQSGDAIQHRETFSPLQLPAFDVDDINTILARGIADLDVTAAEMVREHLGTLGANGEQWVSTGITLIGDGETQEDQPCPFCQQSLTNSTIIDHYRSYFGQAYIDLKQAIGDQQRVLSQAHGGDVAAVFERAVRVAGQCREFWARFVEIPEIEIDTGAFALLWRNAREQVLALITAKQAAPLESMRLSAEAVTAINEYHAARLRVLELSTTLIAVNPQLEVVKEQSMAADIDALVTDITSLRSAQHRQSAQVITLCESYLAEKRGKAATELLRTNARQALDNYRQNVFPTYETAINTYLQRFGAGFRLQGMNSVNNRGGSSVTYSMLINDSAVPLTLGGGPSFRTTLSSGDRNTLALAFFFASLEQEPNLADRIVVFDDPMTSLDEHRSLVTVQEILGLVNRAGQVIALSHSKLFLMGLWNGAPRDLPRASMRINRFANASRMSAWDVTGDCVSEHDRRFARVLDYLLAADPLQERQVAADLRPMLEVFMRVVYPDAFPPGSLLGQFVITCQQRLNTPRELLNEVSRTELRALLDYANRFHHDTNPACEIEIINDQQLMGFAQRVLGFIRR